MCIPFLNNIKYTFALRCRIYFPNCFSIEYAFNAWPRNIEAIVYHYILSTKLIKGDNRIL